MKDDKRSVIMVKNEAVLGRQRMTIQEAKVLRMAITCTKPKDNDFFEREVDCKTVSEILQIDERNVSRDLKEISGRLVRRTLDLKDERGNWDYYPWFQKISFRDGMLSFRLNDLIKPYLLQLEKYYLKYELQTAANFKSIYALRIYEIIKSLYGRCQKSKTTFHITLKELREMTDTENKFERFSSFKSKVLDLAVDEISKYSDILLSYDTKKRGRSIDSIIFYLTEKNKIKSIEPPDLEPVDLREDQIPGQVDLGDVYKIINLLAEKSIPCTSTQAEQLFMAYNSEISEQFLSNLDYVSKNNRIKNRVAYLIKISNDHVAHEPDRPDQGSQQRKKSKTKVETIEPMSESRKQAYIDMEAEYAVDLWPDLPVSEEVSAKTDVEEYNNLVKKMNEILRKPVISSVVGMVSFNENMNEIDDMDDEVEKMLEIANILKAERNKNV